MENKTHSKSVQAQLSLTKDYLNTLNVHISHDNTDLLNWFKGLCHHLTKLIVCLTQFYKNMVEKIEYKEEILLYLQHLLTILSLFINIFVRESEVDQILDEIRLFNKKQMIWSLEGIEEILTNKSAKEHYNADFIKWMDSALDRLNEIDFVNKKEQSMIVFNEAKLFCEELLSHAMSIAQVTLTDDYKKIRGSSQSVLEALESLSNEINQKNPNTAMLNLFIDTCTNKLCALERKVNTTVLKLSLKVFSEYTLPLEAIHNFCFDKNNRGKQNELDDLVVEFDLHVDRILQIGLFAVSCSSCTNSCIKIRSCMASLEALETELVPGFTSVLLDPNLNNVQLAVLLKDHWINQAQLLRKRIFLIIDPFAFCEVIFEENKQLVEEISDTIKIKCILDTKSFYTLIGQSKVLVEFVNVILEEEQETNIEEVKKSLSDFKSVLHEVKAAHDILPDEKTSYVRILKRCKILLSSIKHLWNCFKNENTNNQDISVKEHNVESISEENSKRVFGNVFLDHIIARGKQILKDRSILYRTSIRNETFDVPQRSLRCRNDQDRPLPNLKLTHLRNKRFIDINKTNGELQMTDILHELNNMTNTSLGTK